MEKEVTEKRLNLEEDELVLWSGRPAPFAILDKYYKPVFIRNYIIAILFAALIFIAAAVRSISGGELNLTAVVIICAIPLVVIPLGLSQFRNYRKGCEYFITNKNIIVCWESRRLKLPIRDVEELDSVPQYEGTITVRIGNAVGIPAKKNRDAAMKCLTGNAADEQNKECVLFNLSEKDAATVLELINKYGATA